jgi:transcriptional regulator with XRE-family HTH domain
MAGKSVVELQIAVDCNRQSDDNKQHKEVPMTPQEKERLATLVHSKRQELGFTARELARRAGVDVGVITQIERGINDRPRIESLRAIGLALQIPLADVFATVNWLPSDELPTLRPYMRAKYENLPDEAVDEVERFIASLNEKHAAGPIEREDEH